MTVKHLLFLHGFASSGQGSKAQFLRTQCAGRNDLRFHAFDFNPTPADFQQMTITGMVNRLRQYLFEHHISKFWLVGSSMGALVGLNYAHAFNGVVRILLLAPILGYRTILDSEMEQIWRESGTVPIFHYAFGREVPLGYDFHIDGMRYCRPVEPPAAVRIIHGWHDDVVPIAESRDYAANHDGVDLIEVDSGHQLNDQLPFIWKQVLEFLLD